MTSRAENLKRYWADVRAGRRPAPVRRKNGAVRRKLNVCLDGSHGPDRGKRIILILHPDGRLELRPERTRRAESIHLLDVYRYALRCRVGRALLEKARERKARKAVRLAALRQQRAERRLVERQVVQ